MAPTPNSHRRIDNDRLNVINAEGDANKGADPKDKNGLDEMIPLAWADRIIQNNNNNEDSDKIIRTFITGCSCGDSMKKMWAYLQLLEDSPPRVPPPISEDQFDTLSRSISIPLGARGFRTQVDHVASTTELISTLKSKQSAPSIEVQKEASIMRKYWRHLVQKIPNEETLLLCRAMEKKPLMLDPFLEMLSGCICFAQTSRKPSESKEDETTINMDLKDLLECPGDNPNDFREAQVLVHLVDGIDDMDVKDKILSHPLITTFATLMYQKYQFVSIILLIYHLLFALLLTNYAFHVFLGEHPAEVDLFAKISSVILTLMAVLTSVKTVTTFFASGIQFDINTTRRLGEIFCTLVVFSMCLFPTFGYPFPFNHQAVNKDITAFGVMTSWLILLAYLTKFNQTAVYVQTFFQIVINYLQFLWMVAICPLIALSASYSLIFHKNEAVIGLTETISRSFIRVLTGRMNYNDYTVGKEDYENPVSVFWFFCMFFILTTIMMSMIIGLAQIGLQDIRSSSAVNVLCQVIKDIAELEWIVCKLKLILPRPLQRWLVNRISVKDCLIDDHVLEIRPHDRRDKKIPECLKKSIYNHLMDRGATCHSRPSSHII